MDRCPVLPGFNRIRNVPRGHYRLPDDSTVGHSGGYMSVCILQIQTLPLTFECRPPTFVRRTGGTRTTWGKREVFRLAGHRRTRIASFAASDRPISASCACQAAQRVQSEARRLPVVLRLWPEVHHFQTSTITISAQTPRHNRLLPDTPVGLRLQVWLGPRSALPAEAPTAPAWPSGPPGWFPYPNRASAA